MTTDRPEPARYVMVGGFLGAGKTTAIGRLAQMLVEKGRRVGLITNDQSQGLVDTAFLRSRGHAVSEITGGCFCCRFASLQDAAEELDQAARPDVFLAEPVGSCTDLVATVSYPLRRIYGDRFKIAPLSVLVDPVRAERILGLREGKSFSEKVVYVFRKQLEEAQLLLVNKVDELDDARRERLLGSLREVFPKAEVLAVSARTGEGFEDWLDAVWTGEQVQGPTMEIDYDLYAEGEALLGWGNATFQLSSDSAFDADDFLVGFVDRIRAGLGPAVSIAHLKATLDPGDPMGRLSVVSVVRSETPAELRDSLQESVDSACLVVNVRAETDPEHLQRVLTEACAESSARENVRIQLEHQEFFRPGRPVPTHRITHS